jgi:hypothetical protein
VPYAYNFFMSNAGAGGFKKLGLGLAAIAIVLVGMKVLGSYMREHGLSEAIEDAGTAGSGPGSPDTGPPPLVVRLASTGVGTASLAKTGFKTASLPIPIAVWARFTGTGPAPLLVRVRVSVSDENGRPWPYHVAWSGRDATVLVPAGYAKRPKQLYATVSVDNRNTTKYKLPLAPEPTTVPAPPTGGSLTGISAKQDGKTIVLNGRLPKGHWLGVRAVGTDRLTILPPEEAEWRRFNFVGLDSNGPPWHAPLALPYPVQDQIVYLEVTDLEPVSKQYTVTFPPIPVVSRFGRTWMTQKEVVGDAGGGVKFHLANEYAPPQRQPKNTPPAKLRLYTTGGMFEDVKPRIVSPVRFENQPVYIEMGMNPTYLASDGVVGAPPPVEKGAVAGPRFTVQAEALSYLPRRKAILRVPIRGSDVAKAMGSSENPTEGSPP